MSNRLSADTQRRVRRMLAFALPMLALTSVTQGATGWSLTTPSEHFAASGRQFGGAGQALQIRANNWDIRKQ